MRSNITFAAITKEIMGDSAWIQEQLNSYVKNQNKEDGQPYTPPRNLRTGRGSPIKPNKRPFAGSARATAKDYGNKNSGHYEGKKVEPCNKYNAGTCTRTDCKYDHVCSTCRKPGHTTKDCWSNPANEGNKRQWPNDKEWERNGRQRTDDRSDKDGGKGKSGKGKGKSGKGKSRN